MRGPRCWKHGEWESSVGTGHFLGEFAGISGDSLGLSLMLSHLSVLVSSSG